MRYIAKTQHIACFNFFCVATARHMVTLGDGSNFASETKGIKCMLNVPWYFQNTLKKINHNI